MSSSKGSWVFFSQEECLASLGHLAFGNTSEPEYSYRKCGVDGRWEGIRPDGSRGWTNNTECYTPESLLMFRLLFGNIESKLLKRIAYGARVMEAIGLLLSLVTLCFSIFIFYYFRSLRCDRTRMHRNLFISILICVTVQLVVLVDFFVAWSFGQNVAGSSLGTVMGTIYTTPIVCESLQALIEYTKTVMFMWMLIEGFYLHNLLVLTVFPSHLNYTVYYVIGWGIPLLMTLPWAAVTASFNKEMCWFLYHTQPQRWILDGPRAAIMTINLIFLLSIIRELIVKLRQNHSSEVLQAWKATRAALVLLPLLGVNNFLTLVDPPMDTSIKFAFWSFVTQFFVAFQGFFISLLYCFLNSEVQYTLARHWRRRSRAALESRVSRGSNRTTLQAAIEPITPRVVSGRMVNTVVH